MTTSPQQARDQQHDADGDPTAPEAPADDVADATLEAGSALAPPRDAEDTETREGVVLEVGRALQRYGAPAHRLEQTLERVSEVLGTQGQFFSVPTAILAAFGPVGRQHAGLVRVESGETDLGKLVAVDQCVKDLVRGARSPAGTLAAVRELAVRPSPYGRALPILALALSGAAAAVIFGGNWLEVLLSGFIGVVLGGLAALDRHGRARHVLPAAMAATSAAIATAAAAWFASCRPEVVIIAGVLQLLPGLTLTTAMTELATRHLVSGTARAMLALVVLLELVLGIAFGARLAAAVLTVRTPAPVAHLQMPDWSTFAAVIVLACCYVVLFRARPRDTGFILVAALLAFDGARIGALALGPELGAWVGALIVGVASNAYARVLDRPALVPLVPGILLLVPGSIGLRSLTWMLADQPLMALDAAFRTGFVGIALAMGLLMANVVLPPRRAL